MNGMKIFNLSMLLLGGAWALPGGEPEWTTVFADSVWSDREIAAHAEAAPPVLVAARGEVEHLQIRLTITPERLARGTTLLTMPFVKVDWGEFTGPDGVVLPREAGSFRTVGLNGTVGGDVLIPVDRVLLRDDRPTDNYFTVKVPESAVPGLYRTALTLTGDDFAAEIPIELEVLDAAVPRVPTYPSVVTVTSIPLAPLWWLEPGSPEVADKVAEYIRFLLDYRFCPYAEGDGPMMMTGSPWPWYDERSRELLADERYTHVMVPFYRDSARLLDPANYDPEELRRNLAAIRAAGKTGIFYIADESTTEEMYRRIKAVMAVIDREAPDCYTLNTFFIGAGEQHTPEGFRKVHEAFTGERQIFCWGEYAWLGQSDFAREFHALLRPEKEQHWSYVCMGPGGDEPNLLFGMTGVQNRAVWWRAWQEEATGFLYWSANYQTLRDGGIHSNSGLPDGDGFLVYPGPYFGVPGLLASTRLERWRDGAEDVELLIQVERRHGRETARALLDEFYRSPAETNSFFPGSEALRQFKRRAAELLK